MTIDRKAMKSINRQKVFDILRQKEECTQLEISKFTNLTVASVGKIINEFERKYLVKQSGYTVSNGGRKPIKYCLEDDHYYVAGISIGVGKIHYVISDLTGKILHEDAGRFNLHEEPDQVLRDIAKKMDQIIKEERYLKDHLLGIGVSAPGPLDSIDGIVFTPPNLIKWENVHVKKTLEDYLGTQVHLEKDANCMALSEMFYGAAKNVNNILYLMIDSGIGSSIVVNGHIYKGSSQVAGEIGHGMIDLNGPKCNCGNYGCLEVVASGSAMVNKGIIELRKGFISTLGKNENDLKIEHILFGYLESDKLSTDLLHESSRYVGIKLADKINFLNPELVVIGGSVPHKVKEYADWVSDLALTRIFQETAKSVQIIRSNFSEMSEALGASTIVISNIFKARQLHEKQEA